MLPSRRPIQLPFIRPPPLQAARARLPSPSALAKRTFTPATTRRRKEVTSIFGNTGLDEDWLFFDRARIHVAAGDGGNGCVAFRREKDKPKMGRARRQRRVGGSIFLVCDEGLNTLKPEVHFKATHGQNGMGKGRHGESGEDREIRVAPGTVVRDEESGGLIGELVSHGDRLRVARGGRGGRGNAAFKTARDTTPRLSSAASPERADGSPSSSNWWPTLALSAARTLASRRCSRRQRARRQRLPTTPSRR